MQKLKLCVIFGGMSTEHDVSIVSGVSIIKNLNTEKYEIYPTYIDEEGNWYEAKEDFKNLTLKVGESITKITKIENVIQYLKQMECIFPVLHGSYGEDGTVQGFFELLKIPYVGCKVLSSSISMDKAYTKIIIEKAKIPQAKYVYIKYSKEKYYHIDNEMNQTEISLEKIIEKAEKNQNYPMFVKPSNSGSSVGIRKAKNKEELKEAIRYATKYDSKILIEEGIIGREVECSVLGNEDVKVSCVGEVLSAEEYYTFDSKYNNSDSRTQIPAEISEELAEEIRQKAIKVFKAVDGKGLSRVDFFIEDTTNKVILNEINTMPGFTSISMYPKLWEQVGVSYEKLLEELIKLAIDKK